MSEWSIQKWPWTGRSFIMHHHDEYKVFVGYNETCRLCKKEPPKYILFQWELLFSKNKLKLSGMNNIYLENGKYFINLDVKIRKIIEVVEISEYKKLEKLLNEFGY